MSYQIDKKTGEVVINGWEQGIADSPYDGISDIRNINLISVPKEASVNFATAKISPTAVNGLMTNSSAGADTITVNTGAWDQWQAIQFSVLSDATKGIALNTTYYLFGSGATAQLYSDYDLATLVNITADSLTGTWATVNMSIPKYFTYDGAHYWMVDSAGLVWSNHHVTNSNSWWTYSGNRPNNYSQGNGIASYTASNGIKYIFVFSGKSIDYTPVATVAWVYQWNWLLGTIIGGGAFNANPTSQFKNNAAADIHDTFTAPDNVIYFCDGAWIGRWYEQTGQIFSPIDITTYIADQTRLLPFTDSAQCLSFLGTNLMIGGKLNVIYPWDTTSSTFSYPILLSEYSVQKMVTVNTTTFIFVGNRGRIYYTNGTNAQLYKKIPDHLSGTIEPYFIWGGACSQKNQLYFSAYCTNNAGTAIIAYGGLWAIDLDTKAIRLTNKLSYGTYGGYATAMIPNFTVSVSIASPNPAGTGFYIGWNSGSSTYGIDVATGTPYVAGESCIDSDLIPIGTFLKPNTNGRAEFKLAKPLVSGETVSLWYRQKFSDSFTQIGTTTTYTTNGSGTTYSDVYQNVPFENSQWVQLRVILTSTATSPSYVRLTEIRLGQ